MYCKPEVNPILSKFCTELTAITQDMVDGGVPLPEALRLHTEWLRSHKLLPPPLSRECGADEGKGLRSNEPTGRGSKFAIVTWSDADVAGVLYVFARVRAWCADVHARF